MSDHGLGFHARFPAGPTDADLALALDEAAAIVGMVLLGVEQKVSGVTRRYGEPGGIALPFTYTLQPPCQLVMFRSGPDDYAAPRIAEMFTRVCAALDADIGRSDFNLNGVVVDSEVDGDLEFIDWYQYLGPRVVSRLGRERLLDAPAFHVGETDHGAVVMLLAPDPWSQLFRKAVADHLGIALRPCVGRNPATGEPIVIPWQ